MKLELFNFIDETVKTFEENREEFKKVSHIIYSFLKEAFVDEGYLLHVKSRVKTSESFKEKIIRNRLYIKYSNSEDVINRLTDIIGVRLECRFLEEEKRVYNKLFNIFNKIDNNGYNYCDLNPSIKVKLDDKQPQQQKNGFEIYRIDGRFDNGKKSINFELQIKALVNLFWGDIEHKIMYKNYSYMIAEDFIRNILSSIRDNLNMIDRQLMLVYKQTNQSKEIDRSSRRNQLEFVLAKAIYDIYYTKIKINLGIEVDFRNSCDIIVHYIFHRNSLGEGLEYKYIVVKILERLNTIADNEVYFDTYIEFERELNFQSDFQRNLGGSILELINKDFRWNLFFRILFEVEEGDNAQDLEGFVSFVEKIFTSHMEKILKVNEKINDITMKEIQIEFMKVIYNAVNDNLSLEFLYYENINTLKSYIFQILINIEDNSHWRMHKEVFIKEFSIKLDKIKKTFSK